MYRKEAGTIECKFNQIFLEQQQSRLLSSTQIRQADEDDDGLMGLLLT